MRKKVIIIGGGIAGLSAGIYGKLNGLDTQILEAGNEAGGVCASWRRKGHTVNGSIHWLVGSGPGSDFYDMWRQLGVIDNVAYHNHEVFWVHEDAVLGSLHWYSRVPQLKAHLLEKAPEDTEAIEELCKAILTFADAHFPMDKSFELFSLYDWTKAVLGNFSMMMAMFKYSKITVAEYADKFQSPLIRSMLKQSWFGPGSMQFFIMQLAYAHNGSAGYPLGGSKVFIDHLTQRYKQLGGDLALRKPVRKILVEKDHATGVILQNGEKLEADYVISACDGHTTLFDFLEGHYVPAKLVEAYQTLEPFPPLVYFSAGVKGRFQNVTPSTVGTSLALSSPLAVGTITHERLTFQIYTFDPTLSPSGQTLITAMVDTDYDSWKQYEEAGTIEAEKQKVEQALKTSLEQHFPDLEWAFSNIATPMTYERFTHNHKGSYEGWLPSPEAAAFRFPSHLPGLTGFYMAGHWIAPGGGMPPAAYTGRNAIQLICRDEKQHFTAEAYEMA